jgi:hypothetical protein
MGFAAALAAETAANERHAAFMASQQQQQQQQPSHFAPTSAEERHAQFHGQQQQQQQGQREQAQDLQMAGGSSGSSSAHRIDGSKRWTHVRCSWGFRQTDFAREVCGLFSTPAGGFTLVAYAECQLRTHCTPVHSVTSLKAERLEKYAEHQQQQREYQQMHLQGTMTFQQFQQQQQYQQQQAGGAGGLGTGILSSQFSVPQGGGGPQHGPQHGPQQSAGGGSAMENLVAGIDNSGHAGNTVDDAFYRPVLFF